MLPASERCPVLLCPILPCPVVASRRIALFKERSYMELRHTSNADALAQREGRSHPHLEVRGRTCKHLQVRMQVRKMHYKDMMQREVVQMNVGGFHSVRGLRKH